MSDSGSEEDVATTLGRIDPRNSGGSRRRVQSGGGGSSDASGEEGLDTIVEMMGDRAANVEIRCPELEQLHREFSAFEHQPWLNFPGHYYSKTCAVTQFVQCVQGLDFSMLPKGAAYVLVSEGCDCIPDHFQKWIYCMMKVRQTPILNGSVVPVRDVTRLVTHSKGKKVDVLGLERAVDTALDAPRTYRRNMIQTVQPIQTFETTCNTYEIAGGREGRTFAEANIVEMWLGLVPVEYKLEGEVQRRMFQASVGVVVICDYGDVTALERRRCW
jgi:hypothetical protein